MNNYRSERKYLLTNNDYIIIKSRLDGILKKDKNVIDDMYTISSIYFDDYKKTSYNQVVNGLSERWKYRIRFYNYNSEYIVLEKKYKNNSLTNKISTRITLEELNDILNNKISIKPTNNKLLNEFYIKMSTSLLRPIIFIEYDRIPYVYKVGNTRITLDSNIRYNYDFKNIFNRDKSFLYLSSKVLEVKYSDILPDIIRYKLELNHLIQTSFSKYKRCLEGNIGE